MSTVVSPPVSFTFRALQQAQLTWNLTDQNGNPIIGATVNATCYENRNIQNVTQYPGTPLTGFNNVVLTETPASSGIYVVVLPATINPAQSTNGYVTVITATLGPTPVGTWSIPTVFTAPQVNIDLTTVDAVKAWLGIALANTSCDETIQWLITGFSQYVLNRTGVASFNSIQTYTEIYDGNNHARIFLRNYPIISISNVQIGTYSVPQSTSITTPGVFIEQLPRSIAFRSSPSNYSLPPYQLFPYCFTEGIGNIQITYTAGYAFVPADLEEACIKAVAINYRRKDWQDLISKSLSVAGQGSGTTAYRSWALPPEIERVLVFYQRYGK